MLGFKPQSSDWLASLAHWRFQDWNLNLFNPYWHSEAVWCPPITRNNAVAKSNAWLSPPGNLAGQAWNYQLQMIDKTLIRRALPVWYAAPTPAVTAKETDTQKAKVFLTSAFGIRFAWLPSPNSILWLYFSSNREFLDIPQPREGLFLMAEPKEPPPQLKWQKLIMAPRLLFKLFARKSFRRL